MMISGKDRGAIISMVIDAESELKDIERFLARLDRARRNGDVFVGLWDGMRRDKAPPTGGEGASASRRGAIADAVRGLLNRVGKRSGKATNRRAGIPGELDRTQSEAQPADDGDGTRKAQGEDGRRQAEQPDADELGGKEGKKEAATDAPSDAEGGRRRRIGKREGKGQRRTNPEARLSHPKLRSKWWPQY